MEGNEMVTEGCHPSGDGVDYDQEPMIDVEDVDGTARYVPHEAWKLFGDELQED